MTVYSVNNRPVAKPFNYLFDELFNDYPAAFGKSVKSAVAPANISETLEAYQVELLVPGRNKEDFKISIEKGLLTISYEKRKKLVRKIQKTYGKSLASIASPEVSALMKKWIPIIYRQNMKMDC